jgi:hypothetical protein
MIGGDFGLEPDEFWSVLLEWNARCVPPWDEDDLRDKLWACHQARTEPFGWRLEEETPSHRQRREAWEARMAEQEAQWQASLHAVDVEAGIPRTIVKKEGELAPALPVEELFDAPCRAAAERGTALGRHLRGWGRGWGRRRGQAVAPRLFGAGSRSAPGARPGRDVPLRRSERFFKALRRAVRYVKTFDRWYWDGQRWRQDVDAEDPRMCRPRASSWTTTSGLGLRPFHAGDYVPGSPAHGAVDARADQVDQRGQRDPDTNKKVFNPTHARHRQGQDPRKRKEWVGHILRTEGVGVCGRSSSFPRATGSPAPRPSSTPTTTVNTERGVIDLRTSSTIRTTRPVAEQEPGSTQRSLPTWT